MSCPSPITTLFMHKVYEGNFILFHLFQQKPLGSVYLPASMEQVGAPWNAPRCARSGGTSPICWCSCCATFSLHWFQWSLVTLVRPSLEFIFLSKSVAGAWEFRHVFQPCTRINTAMMNWSQLQGCHCRRPPPPPAPQHLSWWKHLVPLLPGFLQIWQFNSLPLNCTPRPLTGIIPASKRWGYIFCFLIVSDCHKSKY